MYEVTSGIINSAQKVVIYGPEGIGKSTMAAQFPNPVFIDTEGSTKRMNVKRLPKPTSWEMLQNEIREVMNRQEFQTLVIDTIDWAEQLCIKSVCDRHQKDGIEDFGYGKGYVYEKEEFGKLLNLLADVAESGINVVLTAHAQVKKFEQPDDFGSYDRYELKLGQKTGSQISPLVKEWADMLLFANYKTYAVAVDDKGKKFRAQGGERVMYTSHHPCWDAKNRDGLPPEMPFDYSSIAHLFTAEISADPTISVPAEEIVQETVSTENTTINTNVPITEANTKNTVTENDLLTDLSGFEELIPDVPEGIPKALKDLMTANSVSEKDLRLVVSNKGYFPFDMPVANYPEDFINGWVIPFWDKILETVRENQKLPFEI